ncbi:hypothetical protein HZS_3514 [Henneguya salminicola]|nr:hypothetical protein HZS_3514 [Henneguya salminicola]
MDRKWINYEEMYVYFIYPRESEKLNENAYDICF